MVGSVALRRLLPWLIAAVLLYALFKRFPLSEVLAAASLVRPIPFLLFISTYFAYISLADGWSLGRNLTHFGAAGPAGKAIRLRLAANLAMVLNYGIGQGMLAYLVRQHYRISFARSSSILIFQMLNDLYLALTISFAGTFFGDILIGGLNLVPWIRYVWILASLACLAGYFVIRYTTILERVKWIVLRDLFHSFHQSGLRDYLLVMARRLPLLCAGVTYLYFLAPCFDVHIPFTKVVTLLPLIIIIGAIPITPSGLGTVQISAIYLFQGFISGQPIEQGNVSPAEVIFAMSLVFTISIYVLKLASGLMFYRYAADVDISRPEARDRD